MILLTMMFGSTWAYTGPENHLLAMGTVRYAANRIAYVRTPFPGTIVYRGRVPNIGDRVEADQLLATIENRFNMHDYVHLFPQRWELLREVLQVKEAYVQAQIAYQRATDLLELGTISRREFERKESEFRQANAAAKKAEDSLSLHDRQIRQNDLKVTEVRAPIDGYITRAMYASGQMVYEGDPLFEIVDLSEVWVEAYILPQDLNKVQNREHVTLRSTSFPNRRFQGRLINVRPQVEPESKTIRVLYAVANPDLWLKNAMLLSVYAEESVVPAGASQHLARKNVLDLRQSDTRESNRLFSGEVVPKPQLIVEVAAPLWGRINLENGVFPGARVRKGQKLATVVLELTAVERLPLDDRTLQIDEVLELARQKLGFALEDYQRALRIRAENPDFDKEVERRELVYQNALNEYQKASQQRAAQTGVLKSRDPKIVVITSPRSGYIDEVHFIPGEINPTDEFRKLFTIVDLSTVLVRVEVYEKDLEVFENAGMVKIKTPAYSNELFHGTFLSFGDRIDPSTLTIPVYYEIPNLDEKLKIGFRVQVSLVRSSP